MKSIHYTAGKTAANKGKFRAAPNNLNIITPPWREWYQGFDAAVRADKHPNLDSKFSLRTPSITYKATR